MKMVTKSIFFIIVHNLTKFFKIYTKFPDKGLKKLK